MGDSTLIPFGLRLEDQQLVDVSEVERGVKCGCICPSCSTPLLARQGEINEWHFAHASKGVSESTKSECEYSFWVSVTLMAKQVISTANSINLPSLTMFFADGKEVNVAKEKIATIDIIGLEKHISEVYADAVLSVGKYLIAVIFTAPHKIADVYTPHGEQSENIGVLEISLAKANEWLFGDKINGEYSKRIYHHIINDAANKRWLHHPRVKIIENVNNLELLATRPVEYRDMEFRSCYVENKNKNYKCLICNHKWFGTQTCPNCKTHLYASEVKNA